MSSSRQNRRRTAQAALLGAMLLLVTFVVADAVGAFRRLPSARTLVSGMDRAVTPLRTYEAKMMIFGGVGSAGDTCQQWKNSRGEVVTLVSTMLGYKYVERWLGDTWEFYQPGLGLQGKVTVHNSERLVWPHWLVSGYPTIPEITSAIGQSQDLVVEGQGVDADRVVWSLRCQPTLGKSAFAENVLLQSQWRVMLLKSTGLPVRIQPAGTDGGMRGISISEIRPIDPPTGTEWRTLAGPVKATRSLNLECDASDPSTVKAAVTRIRAELDEYKRSQYPRTPSAM